MDSANSVVFCGGVHGKLPMATSTGSAFITRRGYTGDISALRAISYMRKPISEEGDA